MRMRKRGIVIGGVLAVVIAAAVVLAGCTPTELNGYLPGFLEGEAPTTNRTEMVSGLWVNSWSRLFGLFKVLLVRV